MPLSNHAAASWCKDLNTTTEPDDSIAGCSSKKVWCVRGCKRHRVLISAQAANRSNKFSRCKYCSKRRRGGASRPERQALPLITRLAAQQNWPVITESKVLRGKYGAIDFGIPVALPSPARFRVVWVEVDGKQHRVESCRGISPEEQAARDRRKDRAAAAAGEVLVRLFCSDGKEQWELTLGQAITAAQQQPGSGCVLYTPSYQLPTLTQTAALAAAAEVEGAAE